LREKYQAQQPEDLWRLAHDLRSSAAALGVRHLSRRLADIERNAREHSLDGLEPMLTLLECDLAAALVGGIVEASTRLRDHAALHFLVEHEPGIILGHLAFDESDRLLVTASKFTAPFLARWMSPDEAERVAEWAARIVLSYAISPSTHLDPCDEADAVRLVTTFMLPGIEALQSAASGPIDITPFPTGGPSTAPGEEPVSAS